DIAVILPPEPDRQVSLHQAQAFQTVAKPGQLRAPGEHGRSASLAANAIRSMNITALLIYLALTLICASTSSGPKKASHRELCATIQDIISPQYPPDALASGLQDDVLVEIDIGKDGRVISAREQSGPAALAAAAHSAVLQWRFGNGPLARSIPQQGEIIFRYQIGRSGPGLSDEQDRLVVLVPSELTERDVLSADGHTLQVLAVTRVQPPFPTGVQRINERVVVEVETADDGRVLQAKAVTGNTVYRAAAEAAARQWSFRKIKYDGKPIRFRGR